jgi:hypothetical protein
MFNDWLATTPMIIHKTPQLAGETSQLTRAQLAPPLGAIAVPTKKQKAHLGKDRMAQ